MQGGGRRTQEYMEADVKKGEKLQGEEMDDFGSILERDYGLGRAGKGRIGSRGSKNSGSGPKFDSSARFSESFGRAKLGKSDFGGSFRGRSDQNHHHNHSSGYGSFGSSYSVYDEVFSCNVHSTIPVFEDVFRVPSSRMKVSELRDNEIFRGIPTLKKSSSRVTYEDIFGEAPDDLSGPFSFGGDVAGAKITTASSGLGTPPRKDAATVGSSKDAPAPPQALDVAALKKPQGSFLGMSQNGEQHQDLSNDQFERAWVSVGEVSLTTRPSDIPPPVRAAPARSRASNQSSFEEACLERTHSDSGPPPVRTPPPLQQNSSSELLERVLKERSAHAELSIREKVLDWQKHNLAEEEKLTSPSSPPPSYVKPDTHPSSKTRAETLSKLRAERAAIDRIAAEVEVAAAEQAKVRADRAALEHIERDARAAVFQSSREDGKDGEQTIRLNEEEKVAAPIEESMTGSQEEARAAVEGDGKVIKSEVEEAEKSSSEAIDASTSSPMFREEEARSSNDVPEREEAGAPSSNDVMEREEAGARSSSGLEQEQGSTDNDLAPPTFENKDDDQERLSSSGEAGGAPQIHKLAEAVATSHEKDQTTDSESILSIDSFTTNQRSASTPGSSSNAPGSGAAAKDHQEEAAPETPERLESTMRDHEKSNKSLEAEERRTIEEQRKRELMEEARRSRERSLVARITAEVRERAALEAKAKAERAAAMDRKKSSSEQQQQRRTKPRLREQSSSEVVAKELEDRANPASSSSSPSSSSTAKGGGGGGTRVSLREQLEKERLARSESSSATTPRDDPKDSEHHRQFGRALREDRSLVERMRAEARERAAVAKIEREREERERERLERIDAARRRERERLERLEKERERERERLERELEREREIEREKDRVGLEEKAARERAEVEAAVAAAEVAARLKMERAAVERANAEARARAERAAYDAARAPVSSSSSRPTSAPKQRFANSASMPTSGSQTENGGIRRTSSSTNLESDRTSNVNSNSSFSREDFQELKGETPERRKARLERYRRTQNRAAQALAQKNKRDLELQSEQAERQRLAERLDSDIKRWSVGKDGNIRALLSTLQYVLWPESGWKQVTLTELINPAAVKKAYRRATLCVHPDKMQQKHASVQQKYIAEKVFHILQVAWNRFNSQEML
ncbi:hypothetical protein SELMODRAFT_445035 [Selaginella moellendorffii]|uniref:Uncharacterized protein JAC1L3-1 n=2 Tax=Selaginella moellendorffii TaxID=88036 RepID=D8SF12_SELML|nr:hypothetical protein SELMODRAFT_445035 [Selaginella moellendorffii]